MKSTTSSVMEVDCRCSSPAFSTCQLYISQLCRVSISLRSLEPPGLQRHRASLLAGAATHRVYRSLCYAMMAPCRVCSLRRRHMLAGAAGPQRSLSLSTSNPTPHTKNCALMAPGAAVQLQPSYPPGAPPSARAPTLGSPQKPKTPNAPTRRRPPNLAARWKRNAPLETDHELPAMTANTPPCPAARAWAAPRHARAPY